MKRDLTNHLYIDNWPIRRSWLRNLITWLVVNVQIAIIASYFGYGGPLVESVTPAALAAIVTLMSAYVFGSYLDDKDKREKSSGHETE
jgi:predicted Na+-dependent transporter